MEEYRLENHGGADYVVQLEPAYRGDGEAVTLGWLVYSANGVRDGATVEHQDIGGEMCFTGLDTFGQIRVIQTAEEAVEL